MPNRPSKVYRKIDRPAYTRKKFTKEPERKLKKQTMGDTKKNFPIKVKLIAQESIQISEDALESVRMNVNRILLTEVGRDNPENYRLQIVPYPHQKTRMHGLVGVAKGERFVKGMRASFGKIIGRGARVHKGQEVLIIGLENKENISIAKKALKIAKNKLPKINKSYKVVMECLHMAH